tara:strand:- start:401 stop:874 length:474 start_codon:yes stop_codon:yes gene_type:complete
MILLFKLFLFVINPTKIFLNLDKFNNFIIHSGITLKNSERKIRYDFRAFNKNNTYITNKYTRQNVNHMFPDLFDTKSKHAISIDYNYIYNKITYTSKEIYWGTSNFSIEELIKIENNLDKNYLLGIYDCRHYVNEFCKIALDKEIPIWNLNSLIDDS